LARSPPPEDTAPGCMTLTLMPKWRVSIASVSAIASSAHLLAALVNHATHLGLAEPESTS